MTEKTKEPLGVIQAKRGRIKSRLDLIEAQLQAAQDKFVEQIGKAEKALADFDKKHGLDGDGYEKADPGEGAEPDANTEAKTIGPIDE